MLFPPPLPPASPFLKWAGGKGQLLAQFERFFPKSLARRGYVEPFVGSGAVFFHIVATGRPARCTLLDANPDLINLYVQIRDHVEELIPALTAHRAQHNGVSQEAREAYYYGVRAQKPDPGSVASAARFLYLNKTCFNGLHRLNSKGQFNVPIGSYVEPRIFDPAHLRVVSNLLADVTIATTSFRDCERFISSGDFVYLDPPYEPLSLSSSFKAYAKEGFSQADQTALRDMVARISPPTTWMLSNSTAPFIEELYAQPGMFKHHVLASRLINSKAANRGKIAELLVTNYPVTP